MNSAIPLFHGRSLRRMRLRGPALALALLWLGGAGPLPAQTAPVEDRDPSDLINYPYDLDGGFGGFSVSGRSVQAYRIPFAYSLRAIDEHPWGVKLRFPVSFGIHNLRSVVAGDTPLEESFRTVTFVPGVEFQLPARGWIVKPSVEAGFGKETHSGGGWVALYTAGVKALRELPRGRRLWSLGTGFKWNGVKDIEGGDLSDSYGVIEAGVDFRFPLGTQLAGRDADASVYLIARKFSSDLLFERLGAEPVEIENQYEVGVTFGTEPRLRLWGVNLPRVGLAYRFGGNLTAWRINFGFPF